MTERLKVDGSGAHRFRPTDLLICEKCGHEFSIARSKKKIICPRCSGTVDKSGFVPLTAKRTIWVGQGMLQRYYQEVVFKEVRKTFYSIVNLYRELFIHDVNMRTMRTLGFFAYGARIGIKLAYSVDISWEDTAQLIKQQMNPAPLFSQLDSTRIVPGAASGRHPRPERLILLIDALLLSAYPEGYLHFLQDALTLRYKEYEVSSTYARAHKDRWGKFRRSKKATEVYCGRIWKNLLGIQPAQVPEDWDLDVAREQGLVEGKNEAGWYKAAT
jgi:hypothetical protein